MSKMVGLMVLGMVAMFASEGAYAGGSARVSDTVDYAESEVPCGDGEYVECRDGKSVASHAHAGGGAKQVQEFEVAPPRSGGSVLSPGSHCAGQVHGDAVTGQVKVLLSCIEAGGGLGPHGLTDVEDPSRSER